MTYPRYEIHQEQTDAGEDSWSLVFHTATCVWMVEHLWRRRDSPNRNTVLVARELHALQSFGASRTGRHLSTHLRVALTQAGLPPLIAAREHAPSNLIH